MKKEELAEISMMIIAHAGSAKSMLMESLQMAESGKYDGIDQKLKDAENQLIEANKIHFKAVEKDMNGGIKMDILFIHAEDQFLTTQIFQSTTKALINIHKKIDKIK